MTVTAIVPHWNRAALLEKLLRQLPEQTRPFDRIIVVDNGSTDGSPELAERMGAEVIRLDRNYGFAAAVNKGIAAAETDWVAILNNDVELDPAWLEQLLGSVLTPEEVRAAALRRVQEQGEALLTEYTRRFGRILNADNAAELFPEYAASLESRARFRVAVHPAAQWVRDELFRRALTDPDAKDVVFTAGGNGAGKTSGKPAGDIVFDSTFNNTEHALSLVEQCLAAGKSVQVAYVYRPIAEAFRGVLDRARTEGRVVAVATIIRTHVGAAETVIFLEDRYRNDFRVSFQFVDNSAPVAAARSIALARKEDYAGSRDELYQILESERHRLPAAIHQAAAGPRTRSSGGRQRAADGGQSQQTPPTEATAATGAVTPAFATGKILSARHRTTLDGAWDEVSRAACASRIGCGLPDGPDWNAPRPIRLTSLTACLICRSVFAQVGLLDERFISYLEDVDFGIRCAQAGLTGIYVPTAVAYHEGSATWGPWSTDTVRLLARNQILLTAKYFRRQPRWPIVAGQLLWGLLAFRHGCGAAWLEGRREGRRLARSVGDETRDPQAFAAFLRAGEAEIFARQADTYWRVYRWLVRGQRTTALV